MSNRKWCILTGMLIAVSLVVTACSARKAEVVEKIVTQVVEKPVVQTQVVEKIVEKPVEKIVEKAVPAEDYTTPHPVLSDIRVRRAIAYCIDRDAVIASVYPYVADKSTLRMDAGVPKTHWAWSGPYEDYPL